MTNWEAERPIIVEWVMKQLENKEETPAVLVLEVMKLYKLRLLENPKKVEGTDEGYMVKVKNESDRKEYILFLQRTLASNFREVGAKEGDVLGVISKGRNTMTGYEYAVGPWDKSFDGHIKRNRGAREIL
ncbi:hypothetical protein KKA03_07070 [archaeon]|nr:hypothetical protein [archaeon]